MKLFYIMGLFFMFLVGYSLGHMFPHQDRVSDTIEIEEEDPFIYKTPVPRIWRNAEGTPIPSPTPHYLPAWTPTPTPDNIYRWMNSGGRTPDYKNVPLTLDDDGRVYLAKESIVAIAKTVQIMNDLKNQKNNYRYMWKDPYGYDDFTVRMLLLDYEGATSTPKKNSIRWITQIETKDLPVTGTTARPKNTIDIDITRTLPVTVRGEDEETDPDI